MIWIFITFEIRYKHILKIIFLGGVYKLIHTLTFISCYNSFTTIFNYCIYFFMYVCACTHKNMRLCRTSLPYGQFYIWLVKQVTLICGTHLKESTPEEAYNLYAPRIFLLSSVSLCVMIHHCLLDLAFNSCKPISTLQLAVFSSYVISESLAHCGLSCTLGEHLNDCLWLPS